MKSITVKTKTGETWPASYGCASAGEARLVSITSRSTITVVVAKISDEYYISAPDYGVAIPSIGSLRDTFWIREKLAAAGMPEADAVTVAQVLNDIGSF